MNVACPSAKTAHYQVTSALFSDHPRRPVMPRKAKAKPAACPSSSATLGMQAPHNVTRAGRKQPRIRRRRRRHHRMRGLNNAPARRTNRCATSTRRRNNPSSIECRLALSHTPPPSTPKQCRTEQAASALACKLAASSGSSCSAMQLSLTNPRKNLGQAPAHATRLHPAQKKPTFWGG